MENLFLIVGLGNPGRDYARTRHNAGFLALDRLAERWRAAWRDEKKYQSRLARVERDGRRVILCQPQTFMNASGEAVGAVAGFYQADPQRLLVVVDDADLPLGTLRLRGSGSSGGHHGLESVEQHLGTRDYARLRLGIGRQNPARREITGHVLGRFNAAETALLEKVLTRASEQIECWMLDGLAPAMNRFNGVLVDAQATQQERHSK
jgi:PTH1 family peptidyl-tRNA hydrolase